MTEALQGLGAFAGGFAEPFQRGMFQRAQDQGRKEDRDWNTKEREKDRADREKDRSERRTEIAEASLARQEDAARRRYEFETGRADATVQREQGNILNLQREDRMRNEFGATNMLQRDQLNLSKTQADLATKRQDRVDLRQETQDKEISLLRTKESDRQGEELKLRQSESKHREIAAKLKPIEEAAAAYRTAGIQLSVAHAETLDKANTSLKLMAPNMLASMLEKHPDVPPEMAKKAVKMALRLTMLQADDVKKGDFETMHQRQQSMEAASAQARDKYLAGDEAGGDALIANAFKAMEAPSAGGLTKGSEQKLPLDWEKSVDEAFGDSSEGINKAPKVGVEGTEDAAALAETFGVPRQVYENALAQKGLMKGSVSKHLNGRYDGKDHTGWYGEWQGVPFKLPFGSQLEGATKEFKRELIDSVAKEPKRFGELVEQAVRAGVIKATDDPRLMENAVKILNHEITHGLDVTMAGS